MQSRIKSVVSIAIITAAFSACSDDKNAGSKSVCTSKTCVDLALTCGIVDDGCGAELDCGECPVVCTPRKCSDYGVSCGKIYDGCGSELDCGECPVEEVCVPKTCAELELTCGKVDDGCGTQLDCGECSPVCNPKTCADFGYACGSIGDGCGAMLDCGSCVEGSLCQADHQCSPLPYPIRKNIKGIAPDFHDPSYVIGANAGGVTINFAWEDWQPEKTTECTEGQIKYDGYCYTMSPVNQLYMNYLKMYSDAGLVVTGILYGVPKWARRECKEGSVFMDIFCAPKDENVEDYARFVGFIANYFNGLNGHGRVADFVIHNEVNSTEWFNYGCTKGTCDLEEWIRIYALNWNAAYDVIMKEQPNAKVLISLEHDFGAELDLYTLVNADMPRVSAMTFLPKLIPLLGDRDWRIAWHAYSYSLQDPTFGADDYPSVTLGNIGIIAGWLRQQYPNDPHAWEIQLTEQGLNGSPHNRDAQAAYLCQAFRNILGTPGIESYMYYHIQDYAYGSEEGMDLGLWGTTGAEEFKPVDLKPAWAVWALSNISGYAEGYPSCGFELDNGNQIKITRGFNDSTGYHWITSRMLPDGFHEETAWKLLRNPEPDTQMLYECRYGGARGNHSIATTDPNCEGQFPMGPMGYIYKTEKTGTVPLYRCLVSNKTDHFIYSNEDCVGYKKDMFLGYALKY